MKAATISQPSGRVPLAKMTAQLWASAAKIEPELKKLRPRRKWVTT